MKKYESEAALAQDLREWLTASHWEVYQEVKHCGSICDLIAKRGPVLWAIECKQSPNLDVILQALNWREATHYVSIAAPMCKGSYRVEPILREFGIGYLWMRGKGEDPSMRMAPMRRPKHLPELHEEQKTFCAAGGNRGGYYTPFKATCRNVVETIKAFPGISLRDLIGKAKHHYSNDRSAMSCILRWIEDGVISECRVERIGKKITLYPK